jgi:hypothetical protein
MIYYECVMSLAQVPVSDRSPGAVAMLAVLRCGVIGSR